MKYLVILDNTPFGWRALPESVGLAGGKPLFRPDVPAREHTRIVPAIAVKMSRLGKCISLQWAGGYYGEFAPAILSIPQDEKLICFDGAIVCGEWSDANGNPSCIFTHIRRREIGEAFQPEPKEITRVTPSPTIIAKAIADTSRHNTLKVGDILIFPHFESAMEAEDNDIIQAFTTDFNNERPDFAQLKPTLRTKIK